MMLPATTDSEADLALAYARVIRRELDLTASDLGM